MPHTTQLKLPDDIIEAVRQMMHDDGQIRWQLGDYLSAVVEEMSPYYIKRGERYPRAAMFREIGGAIGCDPSTLRDRQVISEFFPACERERYHALSYHQFRAVKYAGDRWREYAEWALAHLPAPCAAIRDQIKHNGHGTPAWVGRWERVQELCDLISQDEEADLRVRQVCGMVVEQAGVITSSS